MRSAAAPVAPVCVTAKEAAAFIGVSRNTFDRMVNRDESLRRARVYLTPSLPRFLVKRLEAWLSKRPDSSAPGGGA